MIDLGAKVEQAHDAYEAKYLAGCCHVMAIALHELTGLPILALWDANEEGFDGDPGGLVHYFVEDEAGLVYDVNGSTPFDDFLEHWGFSQGAIDHEWCFVVKHSLDDVCRRCPPAHGEVELAKQHFLEIFPDAVFQSDQCLKA